MIVADRVIDMAEGVMMHTELAQWITLTTYGNAALGGHQFPDLFPDHSTFQHCEYAHFVHFKKGWTGQVKEKIIADTPGNWFAHLKQNNADRLYLHYKASGEGVSRDRMTAGMVGGGGQWLLEVLYPGDRSEIWINKWEVGHQDAEEDRVWRVAYGCVQKQRSTLITTPKLNEAYDLLRQALHDALVFSQGHSLTYYEKSFEACIAILDGAKADVPGYHQDFVPVTVFPEQAHRLLTACDLGWVFGGMGSWNDQSFEGDDGTAYNKVSDQLFLSLNRAIATAANEVW